MLPIILVLVAAPVTVILPARLIRRSTRRLAAWPRRWTLAAGILLIAAAQTYLYGLLQMSLSWGNSPEDTCNSYYDSWDGRYGHARYWPLERKCSEFVDMVPSFVNPVIVSSLIAALACAVAAVISLAWRHQKERTEHDQQRSA